MRGCVRAAALKVPYVSVDLDDRGAHIFDTLTARTSVGAWLSSWTTRSIPRRLSRSEFREEKYRLRDVFPSTRLTIWRSCCVPGRCQLQSKSLEERTVGPSLGRDSMRQGELSFVIGARRVLIFMAVYYSGAGLVADFGLTLNILLLICVMAAMRATLTLPGIAGIVLTLGMSVDANVLMNERMREELRNGKSPREAIRIGYERAWSAIRDSNISTFVAGLILFQFGTGPVKGFAVTLCVGVLTGLFSCIVVTRAWYDYRISMRKLTRISV